MKTLILIVTMLVLISPAYSQDTSRVEFNALANFMELRFDGEFESESPLAIGLRYRLFGRDRVKPGLYLAPNLFSVSGENAEFELSGLFHVDVYEMFGIGLGSVLWRTGEGITDFGKEDVFISLSIYRWEL